MTDSKLLRFVQWAISLLLAVLLILYVALRPAWARPIMMTLGAVYIAVRLWMIIVGAICKKRRGEREA